MAGARTRRDFLGQGLRAGAALAASPLLAATARAAPPGLGDLRRLFPDLERHFVFEYYPWYGGPPDYEHWDYLERRPPLDLATRYVPKLGAYDVRSVAVLEQHARWIREAGVGAVALSWWGRNSWENQAVPLILDVLRAHDLKATFALEPYSDARARYYASDILYLLREYGEKRHWDTFLLPRNADGSLRPRLQELPHRAARDLDGLPRRAAPRLGLHLRFLLAAADRPGSRHAARRLRPRHAARRLARVRPHSRLGLRRHRHLRQLHPARELPRLRRGRLARGLAVLVQRQPRLRPDRAAPDERPLLRAARLRSPDAGPRLRQRPGTRARGPRLGRQDPGLVGGDARGPARPGPRQRPQAASCSCT